MTSPLDLIAAARARRASAGLVSTDGIACPNQAWLAYYNARAAMPRDEDGREGLWSGKRSSGCVAV